MELIQEIEQRLGKIAERLNPESQYPHEDIDCTELAECIYALVEDLRPKWYRTNEKVPEEGIPVLGFNKDWIDDGNETGIRECFWNGSEEDWTSAYWHFGLDEYRTAYGKPEFWTEIQQLKVIEK